MPIPIEQRKDLFELSTDLSLLIAYRKAILEKMPRVWVLIHCNNHTKNYGLEVNNSFGMQCSKEETNEIREILRQCRIEAGPVAVAKKTRKKRELRDS